MCGIAGYTGSEPAAPILTTALHRLVYRGYDSAGLATIDTTLHLKKGTGAIEQLEERLGISKMPGNCGIAHTRWATHGGVNDANAHPHLDCKHEVAVVHNGVLENHEQLRSRLASRGHKFLSQTDTEVLPHLIEEAMENGLSPLQAARDALSTVTGTYAVLIATTKEPRRLIAARRGSPLVLAQTKTGTMAASDCLALLDHSTEVYFLEDGEIAQLTEDSIAVYDSQGQRVARPSVNVPWKPEQAGREGFPHYMLKEIYEQPRVVADALNQDEESLAAFTSVLQSARRVVFLGCGTSLHACMLGKMLLAPRLGAPIEVCSASEYSTLLPVQEGTVVLAVSQSGETMDVLNAVRTLKEKGVRVISLVNVHGSSLARESEASLFLNCGPEIGVAATKSYMAQLTLFYLLEARLAGRGIGELTALPTLISHALAIAQTPAQQLAHKLVSVDHAFYIGRGAGQSLSLEAALKLKEIAYIHAEGFAGGELKHGPLALIRKGTPVFAMVTADHAREAMLTTAQETKARGAYVIGVCDEPNKVFDDLLPVPTLSGPDARYYPFACMPALQLLAYNAAVLRGANPDRPVNLAKSVTVL